MIVGDEGVKLAEEDAALRKKTAQRRQISPRPRGLYSQLGTE
jgi:hypothetical protein